MSIPTETLSGCIVRVGEHYLFVEDSNGAKSRGIQEVVLMLDGIYANKGQRRQFHGDGDETAEAIALEYFREFKR